ncbi:MFS transporter [Streptomyces litmocidini]|uniref:MFS transporter n=1 Tax=Streptomyces litmocidini TaxID=67318 RepID=UPI00167DA674|nr:MFS transporter [Streptomyces litmocidini]GGV04202.1 MFS transporter [Streptomyces litmocidini]
MTPPLPRNRNYRVLWSGMLLSELAGEVAYIAFPLLVLAHGGSATAVAGVAAVLAGARTLVSLPAGVLADRADRKRVMAATQGVRTVAMLSVAVGVLLGDCPLWHVLLVAVVEGAAAGVFVPAENAALPQVVPEDVLPRALARNAARPFAALLIGPALAGFTFGLHEVLPFALNTSVLAVSFVALAALHLPRRAAGPPVGSPADGGAVTTVAPRPGGFGPLLRMRTVRATTAWIVGVNLAFHTLVVLVLVVSGEEHVAPGQMGLMMTCFGAGGLVGALIADRLHAAALSPGALVIGSTWVFAAVAVAMAYAPRGVPLGILLGVAATAMPVANTTVITCQLASVPDGLRGRLSGLVALGSELAATAGPVTAGVLSAGTGDGSVRMLGAAGLLAVVAVGATLSPTLRRLGPAFRIGPDRGAGPGASAREAEEGSNAAGAPPGGGRGSH